VELIKVLLKGCHRFRMYLDSPVTSGFTMDRRDSGLEFRQASIFARSLDSSSKVYFRIAVDL